MRSNDALPLRFSLAIDHPCSSEIELQWPLDIHNNQHYRIGGMYHPYIHTHPAADLLTLASTLDDFYSSAKPIIVLARKFN